MPSKLQQGAKKALVWAEKPLLSPTLVTHLCPPWWAVSAGRTAALRGVQTLSGKTKKKVQYNTKHWGREWEGKGEGGGCPPLFPQCLDWTSLEGGAEGRAEALGRGAKVI